MNKNNHFNQNENNLIFHLNKGIMSILNVIGNTGVGKGIFLFNSFRVAGIRIVLTPGFTRD